MLLFVIIIVEKIIKFNFNFLIILVKRYIVFVILCFKIYLILGFFKIKKSYLFLI